MLEKVVIPVANDRPAGWKTAEEVLNEEAPGKSRKYVSSRLILGLKQGVIERKKFKVDGRRVWCYRETEVGK